MPTDTELLQRLVENPDDAARFQVYADLLAEKGDARGELINVQLKLESSPTDAALLERSAKLIADHKPAWLGALAPLGDKDLHLDWRRGFVDFARLGPPLEEYETSGIDFPETITKLLALPSAMLLRELVIGGIENDDWPTSWFPCVEALAAAKVPASLRRLEFNRGGYWDISSTELGDLSVAYPKLQRLEELKIELGSMDLGEMDLPSLKTLELVTGGLRTDNLESIIKGRLPKLEALLLCIGSAEDNYGCNIALDDLEPIFLAKNLANVRHLGLANTMFSDQVAAKLVTAPILKQLKTLDLSRGTFGDEGARVLLDNQPAFAHLERIDLTRSYLSDELVQALQALGPTVILEDNEGPLEADDRYVSIAE